MKIAILTSGVLPVPAVQGGAVENHIDFYLRYNDRYKLHDITVFSVYDRRVDSHEALHSVVNHYEYIEVKSLWAKLRKRFYHLLHMESYYHYTIEYYFHQAWHRLQKQHYDIILLENRPGYALSMKIPKNTQLFLYLHNDFLNSDTKSGMEIYEKATRIITVSQYIANRVKTINKDDKKCTPVLNGINTHVFSSKTEVIVERSNCGFSADDFVIIFAGRITPEKGIRELILSLTKLTAYPNIKLLVIGSQFYGNAKNEDSYVKSLKHEALQLKERIVFTGFIPYSQMPAYYKMADIAVIPSMWDDPCPNSVLEAQSMGLPIITTRRGGIPEEVTEVNAVLLPTDEKFVDHLADAIIYLYKNPEKRKEMSTNAIDNAQRYTMERYVEDFYKAIGE